MSLSHHQFSSCTLASQETVARWRRCPLISHYPLCFKSIANYLQKALFFKLEKWTAQDRQTFAWQKDFSVMRGENCPPTIATYWPISVPLRRDHSILHCAGTSFLSTTQFSFLITQTRVVRQKIIIHAQFLSICPSLAKKPMLNKRLHLW